MFPYRSTASRSTPISRNHGKRDGKNSSVICFSLNPPHQKARSNTTPTQDKTRQIKTNTKTPHLLQLVHPGLKGHHGIPARVTPFDLGEAVPQRLDLPLGLRAAVQRPLTRFLSTSDPKERAAAKDRRGKERRGKRSGAREGGVHVCLFGRQTGRSLRTTRSGPYIAPQKRRGEESRAGII